MPPVVGKGAVHIQGLQRLTTDLRRVNRDVPKAVRRVNIFAAKDIERHARQKAIAAGGVQAVIGEATKAQAGAAHARVVLDPTKGHHTESGARVAGAPQVFGAEFGSNRYPQFPSRNAEGYVFFAAIKERTPYIRGYYETAILRTINTEVRSRGLV